jgi:hypothetical protein
MSICNSPTTQCVTSCEAENEDPSDMFPLNVETVPAAHHRAPRVRLARVPCAPFYTGSLAGRRPHRPLCRRPLRCLRYMETPYDARVPVQNSVRKTGTRHGAKTRRLRCAHRRDRHGDGRSPVAHGGQPANARPLLLPFGVLSLMVVVKGVSGGDVTVAPTMSY